MGSVLRIRCPAEGLAGSGFLHRSGAIVTADHVVKDCSDIVVTDAAGTSTPATREAGDARLDLALLRPATTLDARALPISMRADLTIGTQVSTWGFPRGYSGRVPLLSVGYLAGLQLTRLDDGTVSRQWMVNAAFNRGNSGGPLVLVETGEVIGVVTSKVAPISPLAEEALRALEERRDGPISEIAKPDGSRVAMTESQMVALVLDDLRGQVQLVIGTAATAAGLRSFLEAHGIEP
jgi:hypothetical protein